MKNIIHIISMKRGLGGVQQSFLSYYKFAQKNSKYKQYIFSNHEISKNYGYLKRFFKIQNNFFTFLKHLVSKNSIIYLHNKLPSKKIFYLLKLLPTSNNIIFAESGTAWNIKTQDQIKTYKKNAELAKKKYTTEASGGVNLNNIKKIASTGVDRVSIGMLTQSVSAIDIKLEI